MMAEPPDGAGVSLLAGTAVVSVAAAAAVASSEPSSTTIPAAAAAASCGTERAKRRLPRGRAPTRGSV